MTLNNKGIIAFKLETFYWNDLTLSGWFWYIARPIIIFASYYLMLQGVFKNESNSSLIFSWALGWTLFWYCSVNIISNAKKIRRYVKHTSFDLKDALVFNLFDYTINSFILISFYLVVCYLFNYNIYLSFLSPMILYFIFLPYFQKIGNLAINAADFLNGSQFMPIIILIFVKLYFLYQPIYLYWTTFITDLFFSSDTVLNIYLSLIYPLSIIILISIYLLWSIDKELKYVYKDSIV